MSDEQQQILKKVVLASVGASTSAERIKQALSEAADDLVKVGKELLGDLEQEGEVRAEKMQSFIKNFQTDATKRKSDLEQNFQASVKKTARDLGFVMRDDIEELLDRVNQLEDACTENGGEIPESRRIRTAKSKKSS